MSTSTIHETTARAAAGRRGTPWTATRALVLDLAWARLQLSNLRRALEAHDIRLVRVHHAAMRDVLAAHMNWEAAVIDEQRGWEPEGGRAQIEWTVRTWQDNVRRAVNDLDHLVVTPSLAVPSAYEALAHAVDRLDALLTEYEATVEQTCHRPLDRRFLELPRTAGRARSRWKARLAEAHVTWASEGW